MATVDVYTLTVEVSYRGFRVGGKWRCMCIHQMNLVNSHDDCSTINILIALIITFIIIIMFLLINKYVSGTDLYPHMPVLRPNADILQTCLHLTNGASLA